MLGIGGAFVELCPTVPGVTGAPAPMFGFPGTALLMLGVLTPAVFTLGDAAAPPEGLCIIEALANKLGAAGANVVCGAVGVTIPRAIEALVV